MPGPLQLNWNPYQRPPEANGMDALVQALGHVAQRRHAMEMQRRSQEFEAEQTRLRMEQEQLQNDRLNYDRTLQRESDEAKREEEERHHKEQETADADRRKSAAYTANAKLLNDPDEETRRLGIIGMAGAGIPVTERAVFDAPPSDPRAAGHLPSLLGLPFQVMQAREQADAKAAFDAGGGPRRTVYDVAYTPDVIYTIDPKADAELRAARGEKTAQSIARTAIPGDEDIYKAGADVARTAVAEGESVKDGIAQARAFILSQQNLRHRDANAAAKLSVTIAGQGTKADSDAEKMYDKKVNDFHRRHALKEYESIERISAGVLDKLRSADSDIVNQGLKDAVSFGELILLLSGKAATDKEKASYKNTQGLWGRIQSVAHDITTGGMTTEKRAEMISLMKQMGRHASAQRAVLAEQFQREIESSKVRGVASQGDRAYESIAGKAPPPKEGRLIRPVSGPHKGELVREIPTGKKGKFTYELVE